MPQQKGKGKGKARRSDSPKNQPDRDRHERSRQDPQGGNQYQQPTQQGPAGNVPSRYRDLAPQPPPIQPQRDQQQQLVGLGDAQQRRAREQADYDRRAREGAAREQRSAYAPNPAPSPYSQQQPRTFYPQQAQATGPTSSFDTRPRFLPHPATFPYNQQQPGPVYPHQTQSTGPVSSFDMSSLTTSLSMTEPSIPATAGPVQSGPQMNVPKPQGLWATGNVEGIDEKEAQCLHIIKWNAIIDPDNDMSTEAIAKKLGKSVETIRAQWAKMKEDGRNLENPPERPWTKGENATLAYYDQMKKQVPAAKIRKDLMRTQDEIDEQRRARRADQAGGSKRKDGGQGKSSDDRKKGSDSKRGRT